MWGAKACDLSHSYTLAGNAWNTDFLGLSGACKVFCKTLVQCLVCVEKVIAARCSWCFAYKRMWNIAHGWACNIHVKHMPIWCVYVIAVTLKHTSRMQWLLNLHLVVHQGLTELRVPRRTWSAWVDPDLGLGPPPGLSTQHKSWLSTQHMCVPEQSIHLVSQHR